MRLKAKDNTIKNAYVGLVAPSGKVSFKEFCKDLADGSTVDTADVKAVIDRMSRVIRRYAEKGFSVDCGELGIFSVSLKSRHADTAQDFTADNIKKATINFRPRRTFVDLALDNVEFEKVDEGSRTHSAGGDGHSSPQPGQ